MTISKKIEFIDVEKLFLDPSNPRLQADQRGGSQEELLDVMLDWGLEEIAASVVESGFWPNEALIVVQEKIAGKLVDVVVEGNRRLAAVRLLIEAREKRARSPKWSALAASASKQVLAGLDELPIIRATTRADVDSFIGFRHVTGIKQWEPLEKAEFISKLVESGMSYEEVMRRIGSKTPTVRQNYIALKLFDQLSELEGVSSDHVRRKFSVLFLSLRSPGTQGYLGVDIDAEPKAARKPLGSKLEANAVRFCRWVFGDNKHEPLFSDSRFVDAFGEILGNKEARQYLERTENPRFEVARRLSGGDRVELIRTIERAADEIEQALSVVQHHASNSDVVEAARRLIGDGEAFKRYFPTLQKQP